MSSPLETVTDQRPVSTLTDYIYCSCACSQVFCAMRDSYQHKVHSILTSPPNKMFFDYLAKLLDCLKPV